MKKTILFALFALLATFGIAQPVMDQNGVGAIGSVYYLAVQDTFLPTDDAGPAGASQTWSFNTLIVNDFDTITYVAPSSTSYAADFPTANLGIQQASLNNGIGFAESTSGYLHLQGFAADILGTGTPIVAHQVPDLVVSVFPFTYLDTFSDNSTIDVTIDASGFGIPFVDSARYKNIQVRTTLADGYGTLDLPAASYTDVLRTKEINTQTDSIWIHSFIGWSLYSDTVYTDSTFTWSDNTKGYLLAQAKYVGGLLDNMRYQDYILVGRAEPTTTAFTVYPNPANDRLIVRTDGEAYALRICDLQGRLVLSQQLNASQTELQLGQLPRGCYLYSIIGESGAIQHSGKLLLAQ